ncbi:MAG TPA: flavin reductase family protein [Leifsonia sp.]|jgi:flavin reductase (DIM6/NTAB) family NADH-FMN oxidoreductase RutF|nr:flavin reductase family protein [Leifsonia sp.]
MTFDAAIADPIGIDEYRTLFRRHPAGVAVVALRHGGRPVGFTATSVISVSAAPPLLAFSLQATSSSWPAVRTATTLAVSFLAAGQEDVSARFSASGVDRFANGGWHSLATGEPVIDGAAQWVRGTIVQRTDTGGSYLITVQAIETSVRPADGTVGIANPIPLVYHDRAYHRIGAHSRVG